MKSKNPKHFTLMAMAALSILAAVVFVAALMMNAGVNPARLNARMQPVLDVFRLAHVALWALVFVRWTRMVDWLIAHGYLRSADRDTLIALRLRIMGVFAAWVILAVIGISRITTLLGLGQA